MKLRHLEPIWPSPGKYLNSTPEMDQVSVGNGAPRRCRRHRIADKAYDTRQFVAECRALGVTPHVAQNSTHPGGSAIDARTTRHGGYLASQRIRKRIEEAFGWGKDGRPLRKMRLRGYRNAGFMTVLTIGCHSLLRVAKLLPEAAFVPT